MLLIRSHIIASRCNSQPVSSRTSDLIFASSIRVKSDIAPGAVSHVSSQACAVEVRALPKFTTFTPPSPKAMTKLRVLPVRKKLLSDAIIGTAVETQSHQLIESLISSSAVARTPSFQSSAAIRKTKLAVASVFLRILSGPPSSLTTWCTFAKNETSRLTRFRSASAAE